jgi:hypothetical protein
VDFCYFVGVREGFSNEEYQLVEALRIGGNYRCSMNYQPFIISSFGPIPAHHLHGQAFSGVDLILGNEGYADFRRDRGRTIEPGEDGSYIVIGKSGSETVIGTDFAGYRKMFIYRHGDSWAISDSLIDLARFAFSQGLPVTISKPHLSTFFIDGSFGHQLASLQTSVSQIQLVPATHEIAFDTSRVSDLLLRRTKAASAALPDRYDQAMYEYLRTWVGRAAALLQSDVLVRSDLTGGRDSRAVLALLLAALRRCGGSARDLAIVSDVERPADLRVANSIAERFGFKINERPWEVANTHYDAPTAYAVWKSLCLGVYMPLYIPTGAANPSIIFLDGSGGESQRPFYPEMTLEAFLDTQAKFIPDGDDYPGLKTSILADINMLRSGQEETIHPLVIHYRHFRDRCHGGRSSQFHNTSSPLSSALLRNAFPLCPKVRSDRAQVLVDILINGDRELAMMAYDKPEKLPDERNLADVIDASGAIASADLNGRVFKSGLPASAPASPRKAELLGMLRDDVRRHQNAVAQSGYLPPDYVERGVAAIEVAIAKGNFRDPAEAVPSVHVILAGELLALGG